MDDGGVPSEIQPIWESSRGRFPVGGMCGVHRKPLKEMLTVGLRLPIGESTPIPYYHEIIKVIKTIFLFAIEYMVIIILLENIFMIRVLVVILQEKNLI